MARYRRSAARRISLFDDGASPAEEPQSRAIILSVDEGTKKAALEKAFVHPARLLAPNQGSVQVLEDGGDCVGWGAQPYFSRFSAGGELVLDARFPTNVQSYRAFPPSSSADPRRRRRSRSRPTRSAARSCMSAGTGPRKCRHGKYWGAPPAN